MDEVLYIYLHFYRSSLVCVFFGMPSPHLFSFLMIFLSCLLSMLAWLSCVAQTLPSWLTFAFLRIVCILFNSLVQDHADVIPDPRPFNSQPAGSGEESGHVLEGKSEEKVLSKEIITGTGWSLWCEGNGTVERELRVTRTPQSWCYCSSASNTWTYLIS